MIPIRLHTSPYAHHLQVVIALPMVSTLSRMHDDRTVSADSQPPFSALVRSTLLSWRTWLFMTVLEAFLYARQTPLGGPYVDHWDRYFFHAALFNFVAISILSAPFILLFSLPIRTTLSCARQTTLLQLQVVLLTLLLVLDHLDNEIMRFMGTHLSSSLLLTYGNVGAWGSDMLHSIHGDQGGAWLPFALLLLLPMLFLWRSLSLLRRAPHSLLYFLPRWTLLASFLLPALIANSAYFARGGQFRKVRTRPVLLALLDDLSHDLNRGKKPHELERLISNYQAQWIAESGDKHWEFTNQELPLLRTPTLPAAPTEHPWNILYLQLETFRGRDMGFHRPELSPSPTPFLDSLANDPRSSYWIRHSSFGPPTVGGFMAGHCSVRPHSREQLITAFTYINLHCIPSLLRDHGYRTEFFTASDPDWDNEGFWLRKWYDQYHFYRDADEQDRVVFRQASERILELGRSGQPFMATVVSISNHYPFRSREAQLDIHSGDHVQERILNTTHYTDDVVREFFETLRKEPWFAHTVGVIVGDHAYNLGEHDGVSGQRNGHHEGTWVPLMIHGQHPQLPRGRQDQAVSLLDIAPTLAAIAGIRQENPWLGHNLLAAPRPLATVTGYRPPTIFAESPEYSLMHDPDRDQSRLFKASDLLQEQDIASSHPSIAASLLTRAREMSVLFDYLLESDRVWNSVD